MGQGPGEDNPVPRVFKMRVDQLECIVPVAFPWVGRIPVYTYKHHPQVGMLSHELARGVSKVLRPLLRCDPAAEQQYRRIRRNSISLPNRMARISCSHHGLNSFVSTPLSMTWQLSARTPMLRSAARQMKTAASHEHRPGIHTRESTTCAAHFPDRCEDARQFAARSRQPFRIGRIHMDPPPWMWTIRGEKS